MRTYLSIFDVRVVLDFGPVFTRQYMVIGAREKSILDVRPDFGPILMRQYMGIGVRKRVHFGWEFAQSAVVFFQPTVRENVLPRIFRRI